MRALIVAIVASVAGVVVAAALWPRVVGGEAVQAELRRVVGGITGRGVTVRGRIGLDLLPRPRLSLARVVAGGGEQPAAGGAPRLEADRVDLEVAPLAFVGGRIEVTNVRLVRPKLALAARPVAALVPDLLALFAHPSLARLESVRVVDGRADLAGLDTRAGVARLEALDGTLRRDALLGRVALSATASAAGTPLSLEGEVGEPAGASSSSLRFELAAGPPGRTARLDFRGFGTFGGATPRLKGEFEFDATDPAALQRLAALVRDVWPADQLPRTGPLRLEGQAELSDRTLRLSEVTCHLGSNTLGAGLELALAGEARLDLRIDGAEFVVDADAGGDLRRLASLPWWEVVPQGRVTLRLGAVRWREQAVARQLRLDAVLAGPGTGGGVARVDRLTATLPGAADLSLTGTLRQEGGVPSLAASLSLTAEDTRALLGVAGVHLDGLLPGRSVRTLALTGALAASPARVAVRDLDLRLDGSRLTGSAAWVAGPRPRLALSGSLDRLDIGDYLPTGRFPDGGERFRDRLTAVDATVDLSVGRAMLGELRGEGLYLRVLLERGLLRLTELSVRDLAEAKLRLAGSGDLPVASFELAGELESARPARLLRALGLDAPPTVTRFTPVRVTGTARGNRESTALQLGLNAAGLSARLGAAVGPWFDPSSGDLELTAEAARLGDALRDLGLGSAAGATGLDRPLRLAARLRRAGDSYALSLDGEALPSRVEARLDVRLGEGSAAVTGTVDGSTVDHDLLVAALEAARLTPDPVAGTWLGRLPPLPLTLDRFRGLDLDLRLRAARVLGVGAGEPGGQGGAAARLRLGGDHLSLDDLRVPLAGGELAGVLTVDTAEGGHAVVGIDVGLDDVRPERLLPMLGAGGLAGELDLGLRLAGAGRTLPELVGSFEGEGDVQLRQGRLRGVGLVEGSAAVPVGEAAAALDPAREEQLRLGGALAVSRGVLASPPPGLALAMPGADGTAEIRLDLLAWMAEIGLNLSPAEPLGASNRLASPRRFLGPPGRLRDVSVTPAPPLPQVPPPAEASPTGPASPPAGPTGRTPPA